MMMITSVVDMTLWSMMTIMAMMIMMIIVIDDDNDDDHLCCWHDREKLRPLQSWFWSSETASGNMLHSAIIKIMMMMKLLQIVIHNHQNNQNHPNHQNYKNHQNHKIINFIKINPQLKDYLRVDYIWIGACHTVHCSCGGFYHQCGQYENMIMMNLEIYL